MRTRILISATLALAMLAMAMAVQAQPPGVVINPTAPFPIEYLVLQKSVQEDLKTTEEQAARLQDWSKDFNKTRSEVLKQTGIEPAKGFGKKGLSQEDVDKFRQAQAEVASTAFKQLGEILQQKQMDRLRQIEVQNQGLRAFEDPTVANALKLTNEQKSQLKKLRMEFQGEQSGFAAELRGKTSPEKTQEIRSRIQEAQKVYVDKLVDGFSFDQKRTWKMLAGRSIEITPPVKE